MQVALIQFFRYLEMEELIDRNPARLIRPVRRTQRTNDWLRPDEDRAMLAAPKNLRERFTVYLLRHTGMRVGEATSVLNSDVDVREWSITIRKSKTDAGVPHHPDPARAAAGADGVAPVPADTRPAPGPRPAAGHRTGRAMDKFQVLQTVKRAAVRAELRLYPAPLGAATARKRYATDNTTKVSCHTLRRTFGSDLINRGARLEVVFKLLGHSSTMVTEKAYAELLEATIAREVLELVR